MTDWRLPPDYRNDSESYTAAGIAATTAADDAYRAHLADLRDDARALGLTITQREGWYELRDAGPGRGPGTHAAVVPGSSRIDKKTPWCWYTHGGGEIGCQPDPP